jgi:riboflavin kinase/FMN adenylyltransferase
LRVHYDIASFNAHNTVLTIGTFDGVHLGHKKVIGILNEIAHNTAGESVVFSFYPHPRMVLSNTESGLKLLNTLEEKIKLLAKTGVDHLVLFPFDRKFASLTYTDFVKQILLNKLKMRTLVVGHDHKLGKNREGTFDNISRMGEREGFSVKKIEALILENTGISSSKIRVAIEQGDVVLANKYLDYVFNIKGIVKTGNQIGRSIGFPTANIEVIDPNKIIPAVGVYAISVYSEGAFFKGMLNIGHRPTVNENIKKITIEAHLFDFDKDIYNKEIVIFLHRRIRDEQKFEKVDQLKEQLEMDEVMVREILGGADLTNLQDQF